jgi:peptidyl-prolyl cis-trans isomerase A (cyclophilin A)
MIRILVATVFSVFAMSVHAEAPPEVIISTDLGDIVVALESQRAPATTQNFLHYVDRRFYEEGVFHRTVTLQNQPDSPVKIEVVQAGISPQRTADRPPITLERTSVTGLAHHAGTLSMARGGPDTATSDFFICVTDAPELDFGGKRNPDGQGFAAFGHVVRGMDVVRKIQQSPATGQKLEPPIRIRSIRRLSTHEQ